jgi:hypothetical protein
LEQLIPFGFWITKPELAWLYKLIYAASAKFDIEWDFGENTTTVIGTKETMTRKNMIFLFKKIIPEE